MLCDLVGSTSLAVRLDAEDWRNLANTYLDEASAAVTVLSGHVLKMLGDGLMALLAIRGRRRTMPSALFHPLAEWPPALSRLGCGAEKRLAELESELAQVKLDRGEHAPRARDIPLIEARTSWR